MPKADPAAELKRLAAELRRHDELYYRRASPEISDAAYDELHERYQGLADELGVPADKRHQRTPGDDRSDGFQTVRHRLPMLSLEKASTDPALLADGFDVPVERMPEAKAERERTAFGKLEQWEARTRKALGLPATAGLTLTVEPKIDGMSVSLTYEAGRLAQAVTRGNGIEGDLITTQVMESGAAPAQVKARGRFEVRGELYLPRAAFDSLNRELVAAGERALINPRNGCAGLMKRKDPEYLRGKGVRSFLYAIAWAEGIELPAGQWLRLEWLEKQGFTRHSGAFRCDGSAAAYRYCLAYAAQRGHLDHDIDGMVIKLDDTATYVRLGETEHHPRWGIAYKFPPARVATVLTGVTVQVGKTGKLTPVAELTPVFVAGTTVSRASLHNFAELAAKDVRIGDTVLIEKAGEIIPQVVSVDLSRRPRGAAPVAWPSHCPTCGTAAVVERRADPSGKENVSHYCPNPACADQVRSRLVHFASRAAMEIDGLGWAVVDKLVEHLGVARPDQLYRLTVEQLEPLEMERDVNGVQRRFGAKNAANLVAALAASRSKGLARVLAGLAIHNLGEKLAEDLAKRFGSWQELRGFARDYLRGELRARFVVTAFKKPQLLALAESLGVTIPEKATVAAMEDLIQKQGVVPLKGIDETVADIVFAELTSPALVEVLEGLAAAGVNLTAERMSTRQVASVAGKSFVLTGTLPTLKRHEAEALIKAAGGTCFGSVSKKTDYLVAGEDAGSKLDKAKECGVTIISEDELRALLAER